VHWRELGEVENEHTSYDFRLFAIFVPKIVRVGGDFTKLWQKQFCLFFWDTVYISNVWKMIGKGFVLFKINSSPSAFYIIKPNWISWLVLMWAIILKKVVEKRKPERLFMLASDDIISVRIQTSSLFILQDGVKFNIWDIVSTV